MDTCQGGQGVRVVLDDGVDAGAQQGTDVVQGAVLHGASGTDNGDGVTEGLHLGQDVAGEQDGGALFCGLDHALAEDLLHEGVQAGGGLVEDEEVHRLAQGGDKGDLLPVALGVGAHLLARVQVETLNERGATSGDLLALGPGASSERGEGLQGLAPGERGPQGDVAGHVGQALVEGDGVVPGVGAEEAGPAAVGADHAQQDAQGGGLARPVGAEEASHLTGGDAQVQAVQGAGSAGAPAEDLDQAPDVNDGGRAVGTGLPGLAGSRYRKGFHDSSLRKVGREGVGVVRRAGGGNVGAGPGVPGGRGRGVGVG